jgi:hypothetical protein
LMLNKYFQRPEGEEWNTKAIRARGEHLFQVAVGVWPKPATPSA